MKHLIVYLVAAFIVFWGGIVQSAPVEFKFKGTVNSTLFDPSDVDTGAGSGLDK
jgi:hypothetical protein